MEEKPVTPIEDNSKSEPKGKATTPPPVISKAEPVKETHGGLTVNCDKAAGEDKPEDNKPEDKSIDQPQAPKPDSKTLFSVKSNNYHAWVTQHGEKSFMANLELVGGSSYNWPASSASEAEALLRYHIINQKL